MNKLLWRISDHADLSGRGGMLSAARWHDRGQLIVYAAESSTGALTELLAHTDRDLVPPDFQLLTLEVGNATEISDAPALQAGWTKNLPGTRAIGNAWLASGKSALLRVPSALISHAHNVLINPLHPDASEIRIVSRERLVLDKRLK